MIHSHSPAGAHVDLLPIRLALDKYLHISSLWLLSFPLDHSLHCHVCKASHSIKRFKSPLHNLLETIHPTCLHPNSTLTFSTFIPQNEEAAIAYDKAITVSIQIYADGSSINGKVGAVAILYVNKTPQKSLQYYLSLEDHHTVYEAELVGPILAAALLQQLDFPEDTSITINNQVAIKATTNCYSTLGQQFIKFFFNQMSELAKRHQGVPFKIHWIPGHKVISGNEADN